MREIDWEECVITDVLEDGTVILGLSYEELYQAFSERLKEEEGDGETN